MLEVIMKRIGIKRAAGAFAAVWIFTGLSGIAAVAQEAQDPRMAPEAATGRTEQTGGRSGAFMITAAHPLATEAGHAVLAAGGNAVDAMVATQMVLNLVEPQSSGIGGGAFLVYFDAATGEVTTYDGRETAPMSVDGDLFMGENGEPMEFWDAVVGGRSVGTPGTLKLMEHVHGALGSKPFGELLQPAIDLAEDGFEVGARLSGQLQGDTATRLQTFNAARDYFFPEGNALSAGDIVTNPEFAETLRLVAQEGSDVFYKGEIAEDIVAAVNDASVNPGTLSMEDMAAYEVVERAPVCHDYRQYEVCGMGPPSSGALTIGQILGMLEHFDMASFGPETVDAWHLIAEAEKLAFADRAMFMADSDFVSVPVEGLLDAAYLTGRAQLIAMDTAAEAPVANGNPPWRRAALQAPDTSPGRPGTSHVSIIDAEGNAVSLTTTIESGFGSNIMVRGFLLNNELTDFSFAPESEEGRPIANRVEPGKRPRSSMAPTIVLDDGELEMVVGSPGGISIIGYVVKTLVATLDWDMDLQAAVDLGHVFNANGTTVLEEGTEAVGLGEALEARGHQLRIGEMNSGLHAIRVGADGYEGAADPRREGTGVGD
jgi:gamma-glutamyltranspeptidase / glutathione hydrolase